MTVISMGNYGSHDHFYDWICEPDYRRCCFFFCSSTTLMLSRVFKDGFQHVEMLTEFKDGTVVRFDPRWGRVDLKIKSDITFDEAVEQLRERPGTRVIFEKPSQNPKRIIRRGWAITCASYLAYTIGLPFGGVTPYQLYKHLLKKGAVALP
jgi:hypothetical protein